VIKKILTIVMALVVASTLALATPDTAHAGISCYGKDHYHLDYRVHTKHDNTGKVITIDRVVFRVWDIKKDRNRDGKYRHDHYDTAYCGYPT
jgi:hypothetical protein